MNELTSRLLKWYQTNGRKLPWRDHPDAYRVWVSEIMLQQTQVKTVIPYYTHWLNKFPDFQSLAHSSEEEVLLAWEGLGYYTRARNLLKASRIIVDRFGGAIPQDRKSLLSLPGIGRYTVGAILSIAFNQNEPILDGNVARVLSRVFNITELPRSKTGEDLLWKYAGDILPEGNAGNFNQALMDLGALVCLPKKPACQVCPLLGLCEARRLGVELERPIPMVKKQLPVHTFYCFIIHNEEAYFLVKNESRRLLGGLWEFPSLQMDGSATSLQVLETAIKEEYGFVVTGLQELGIIQHAFTHFKSINIIYLCQTHTPSHKKDSGLWVPSTRMEDYPMGKVARKISNTFVPREPDV